MKIYEQPIIAPFFKKYYPNSWRANLNKDAHKYCATLFYGFSIKYAEPTKSMKYGSVLIKYDLFEKGRGDCIGIQVDKYIFANIFDELYYLSILPNVDVHFTEKDVSDITRVILKCAEELGVDATQKKKLRKVKYPSSKWSSSAISSDKKTYIMKDKNNGFYKIGRSVNPKFREKTLQSEKPNIKIVKVWDSDIEYKLHSIYRNQRVRGEWFKLSKIQVRYICTHY